MTNALHNHITRFSASSSRSVDAVWGEIEYLKSHKQTELISHQPKHILMYEGHLAPGGFLILDGTIHFESRELDEEYTTTITQPSKTSNLEDVTAFTPLSFFLIPEIKHLELRSPYTLTFLTHARSLFIPRTLMLDEKERTGLHMLSQLQERNLNYLKRQ